MANQYTPEERLILAAERGIIVDDEDQWLLRSYTWYVNTGYAQTYIPGTKPRAHAILHHCVVGRPLNGMEVDHIDRNTLNNRKHNLRYVSHGQNHINSDKSDEAWHIMRTSWSGKYQVAIRRDSTHHYLGVYETVEEAEVVRDNWLRAHE